MKSIFGGLVTAFSMYSALPMPHTEWDSHTMKYAMCFFPLIGVLVGAVVWLWAHLCGAFAWNNMLFAVGICVLPIVISGGIHIDGLIDTGDALGSHQTMERKLEILKDSHVGAFGVILCVCFLLLTFGFGTQLAANPSLIMLLCLGYVLSRGFSAFAVVSLKLARNTGLAHAFADGAAKKTVRIISILWILAAIAGMILINPIAGIAASVLSFIWFVIFKGVCYRKFGGLTGDLAGFLLCFTELIVLVCAAVL
ncbi:MAG: adenosylcobinamide-GDP ribazoletransferase [Christensenella sp.]